MNPNNSHHQGDEANSGRVPRQDAGADRHTHSEYEGAYAAHRREPPPDLDAGAARLPEPDVRRMNRRALGFLGGIVALLLFVAFFLLSSNTAAPPPKEAKAEETVKVTEAPRDTPRQDQPSKQPEPIALEPSAALPAMLSARPTSMAPARTAPVHRGPSLVERRMMDSELPQIDGNVALPDNGRASIGGPGSPMGMIPGMGMPGQLPAVPINTAYGKVLPDVSNVAPLTRPDTLMLRGTYIRCVLETRIVTDIPGFTSCVVTEPVYSFTGKRLLLPKGSKVLGKYETEPNGPRVAVIWDRIITPTGIDVNMASPGIDRLGGAGHPGHYNAHWGSRIGAALLISLLSDAFKYEAAKHGPSQTTISNGVVTQNPFESNTAQTIQQIANNAIQRSATRPATVTINQGTSLAIYVAKDVDFSGVMARN